MDPHGHSHESREREVIVTDNGRDSSPLGMVLAIVGIIAVLLVAWYAINAIGGGDVDGGGIDVPSEVNVDVNNDGGGTGSDG
jgi:hypothetical protein